MRLPSKALGPMACNRLNYISWSHGMSRYLLPGQRYSPVDVIENAVYIAKLADSGYNAKDLIIFALESSYL